MKLGYGANGLGDISKRQIKGAGRWVSEVSKDKGCAVSPSCLSCPLERCQYEVTVEERAALLAALT